MKKFLLSLCTLAVLAFIAVDANAQIKTPSASQGAKFSTTVGLTDVTLEYSRPSVKGRTIFANDGLVPLGKAWRTGANAATKVTFSDDVKVAGKEVKAGSYAVITEPSTGDWKVMMFPYESGNWSSYLEKTPAVEVMAKSMKMPMSMETFTMLVGNVTSTGADIQIMWADMAAMIPFTVEVDKTVMAAIEKTLNGPSTGDYYTAGTYYHESGKDLATALKYVQMATNVEEPRFWQVRREALILADMGKFKDAIAAAEKSKMLAEKAGNEDYVRMNEKSIALWSTAKPGMKGNAKERSKKTSKM